MTMAVLNLLGTCIFRKHCVRVNISCTERRLNLSAEAFINGLNRLMDVHVPGAHHCSWRINKFIFPKVWQKDCFEETQISIQDFAEDVYCPRKLCSAQKCVFVNTWKEIG